MAYCHADKAGNRGDLIKHLALSSAISKIVPGKSSFSYMEVHCGQADHTLKEDGEWHSGIGRFIKLSATNPHTHRDIDYFRHLLGIETVDSQKVYHGSSRIVYRLLHDLRVANISMHLCDTDADVCASLTTAFGTDRGIHIYCEDGYSKAKQLHDLDLVFIDPPDMGQQFPAYIDLIQHCLAHRQPFISWNSLHGNAEKNGMSERCHRVSELARDARIPHIAVRWSSGWTESMCGCQMLFSHPGGNSVSEACRALASLMQWPIAV